MKRKPNELNIGNIIINKCSICEHTSTSKKDLKYHEENVHSRDTNKCYLCQIPFNRIDSLRKHMEKAHPEHEFLEQKCTKCHRVIAARLYQDHLDTHQLTSPKKLAKPVVKAIIETDTRKR